MGFLIPAIIAAVGAGASLLKAHAAGQSVQTQQQLYDQWLANRQTGINDVLEQLTNNGFNPFGPQTTTQFGSTNSLSTAIQNMLSKSSVRPVITPQYQPVESAGRNIIQQRLNMPTGLPAGYIQSQVRNINKSFAGADQAARNAAASKGLSADATFGAAMPSETARAGKIADFLGTVPLTEKQLRDQDIAQAADWTKAFGTGSDTTTQSSGTTTTKGSTTSSGSISAPPNFSALLQALLPPPPGGVVYPNPNNTASMFAQGGGDLFTILMQLYKSGAFDGKPKTGVGFE